MKIFKHQEYRYVIKEYLQNLPKKGFGASQKLSQHIGIHPTQLSQILAGQKDLTVDQALAFTKYVAFSKIETEYFIALVQWARAYTVDAKSYFQQRLQDITTEAKEVRSHISEKFELSDVDQAIFYSSWIYSAIRLACSFEGGQTLETLEEKFLLERNRIGEVIRFLLDKGLCIERDQRFYIGPSFTHLEKKSPFLVRHHLNWRNKALQKMDRIEDDELFFTGPISLSQEDFAQLKALLLNLISETSKIVKVSPAEQLCCLNIDLFKVTDCIPKGIK